MLCTNFVRDLSGDNAGYCKRREITRSYILPEFFHNNEYDSCARLSIIHVVKYCSCVLHTGRSRIFVLLIIS